MNELQFTRDNNKTLKKQITIRLDENTVDYFKDLAEDSLLIAKLKSFNNIRAIQKIGVLYFIMLLRV